MSRLYHVGSGLLADHSEGKLSSVGGGPRRVMGSSDISRRHPGKRRTASQKYYLDV